MQAFTTCFGLKKKGNPSSIWKDFLLSEIHQTPKDASSKIHARQVPAGIGAGDQKWTGLRGGVRGREGVSGGDRVSFANGTSDRWWRWTHGSLDALKATQLCAENGGGGKFCAACFHYNSSLCAVCARGHHDAVPTETGTSPCSGDVSSVGGGGQDRGHHQEAKTREEHGLWGRGALQPEARGRGRAWETDAGKRSGQNGAWHPGGLNPTGGWGRRGRLPPTRATGPRGAAWACLPAQIHPAPSPRPWTPVPRAPAERGCGEDRGRPSAHEHLPCKQRSRVPHVEEARTIRGLRAPSGPDPASLVSQVEGPWLRTRGRVGGRTGMQRPPARAQSRLQDGQSRDVSQHQNHVFPLHAQALPCPPNYKSPESTGTGVGTALLGCSQSAGRERPEAPRPSSRPV